MKVHFLKCWPKYFRVVKRGSKKFEVRKNDRGFKRGDTIQLECWNPKTGKYSKGKSARPVVKKITYILKGPAFGVKAGFVVMSLE